MRLAALVVADIVDCGANCTCFFILPFGRFDTFAGVVTPAGVIVGDAPFITVKSPSLFAIFAPVT
jgi:hypothetical protein